MYVSYMNWQFDATTIAPEQSAWSQTPVNRPAFADNTELKQAFAIGLANGLAPLDAGLQALGDDVSSSVWASVHWLKDIEVIAFKDAYLAAKKAVEKPLDKDELLAKIKEFVEERDMQGRPLVDAKERLNGWRLYSDIRGFTGKVEIDASTNKFTNKTVNLVMVKPDTKEATPNPNIKSQILNQNEAAPIKLKLVAGAST